jgi:predicted transcriptional regulator
MYALLLDKVLSSSMRYRNRTEITSQILDTAIGGATKTKIMYKAYLSYAQMKEYLETLLENKLLELDENHIFKTTDKGIGFLHIYQELDKLAPKISNANA